MTDTLPTSADSRPLNVFMQDNAAMLDLLQAWADTGWLRQVDVALTRQLHVCAPHCTPACLLAAALVSQQAGHGHLLLDLASAPTRAHELLGAEADTPGQLPFPSPETVLAHMAGRWPDELRAWSAVSQQEGNEPLVLDNGLLYLRRYWRHERTVTQHIGLRLAAAPDIAPEALRPMLAALFPSEAGESARWQKIACALGARAYLTVITGGPGTGKTTTVIKLLALLQAHAVASTGTTLRIGLTAPTGKAAARLNESIATQVQALQLDALPHSNAVREAIPREVGTIHRLLGARAETSRFRHHRYNPLPLDLVVVDEASMVDIELMAALLEALPAHARLILLGDKDQLASVEAGAVLGSLCQRADAAHYLPATADWVSRATGAGIETELTDHKGRALDQCIVMLRHSFRFDHYSAIGRLARAVNQGDARTVRELLDAADGGALRHFHITGPDDKRFFQTLTGAQSPAHAASYATYLQQISAGGPNAEHPADPVTRPPADAPAAHWDAWAASVLAAHRQFQLLTPLRRGDLGVSHLNRQIELALAHAGLIRPATDTSPWYEGRPVLVTGNDYALELMNGDIGLTLAVPAQAQQPERRMVLRVAFPAGHGRDSVRWVLPSRLHHVETAYAMTVHKAQGSEFAHTALIVPESPSPVLTRELIYTAITRARHSFTLYTRDLRVIDQSIARTIERHSRLFRD